MAECATDMGSTLSGLFNVKFASLGSFCSPGGTPSYSPVFILGVSTIVKGSFFINTRFLQLHPSSRVEQHGTFVVANKVLLIADLGLFGVHKRFIE